MRAPTRVLQALALIGAFAAPAAHAGLFDDDEARKAILELRQRLDQTNEQYRTKQAEQIAQLTAQMNSQVVQQNTQLTLLNEQMAQIKRSMVELNNLIEQLKADNAKLRGQDEQLAREIAEVQRKQKDLVQGVDDRIRKIEPVKVSVDDREFLVDPDEKRQYDEAMGVFRKGDFEKAAAALVGLPEAFSRQRLSRVGAVLARQCAVRQARLQGSHSDFPRLGQRLARPPARRRSTAVGGELPARAERRQGRAQDARRADEGLPEVGSRAGRQGTARHDQAGLRPDSNSPEDCLCLAKGPSSARARPAR